MQGRELFTLNKAQHRLSVSKQGYGGSAVYTGWLNGQPVVSDRTKGRAFKKLLDLVAGTPDVNTPPLLN